MNIAVSDMERAGGIESTEIAAQPTQVESEREVIRSRVKEIVNGIPPLGFKQRLNDAEEMRIALALANMEDRGYVSNEPVFDFQKELNISPNRMYLIKRNESLPCRNLSEIEKDAMFQATKIIDEEMGKRTPKSREAFSPRLRKAIVVYYRYLHRTDCNDIAKYLTEKGISPGTIVRLNKEFYGEHSRDLLPEIYPQPEATAEIAASGEQPLMDEAVNSTTPVSETTSTEETPRAKEEAPQEEAQPAAEAPAPAPVNTGNQEKMAEQLELGNRLINELSQLRDDLRAVLLERQNPSTPAADALIPTTPVKAVSAQVSEQKPLTQVQFGGATIFIAPGSKVMILEG